MVFDEAHCLRNEKTARHAACANLQCSKVHCLTGTPLVNSSNDVLALFRIVGFRGPKPSRPRLRSLARRLMLRRRKRDPAPDGGPLVRLPPLRETDDRRPFRRDAERSAYDALLDDARKALGARRDGDAAFRAAALTYLGRLCRACSLPPNDAGAGADDADDDAPASDDGDAASSPSSSSSESDDGGSTRKRPRAAPPPASTKLDMLRDALAPSRRALVFSRGP